jgi:hypothetical protein
LKIIAKNLIKIPVEGLNLVPGNFGDQFQDSGDLLFFLRHLG